MIQNGDNKQDKDFIIYIDAELKTMTSDFLKNRHKDIKAIQEALDKDDYQTIQTLGHRMKGSGGVYGFNIITQIGGSLEEAAKNGSSEEVSGFVSELAAYLEQVKIIYNGDC